MSLCVLCTSVPREYRCIGLLHETIHHACIYNDNELFIQTKSNEKHHKGNINNTYKNINITIHFVVMECILLTFEYPIRNSSTRHCHASIIYLVYAFVDQYSN